MVMDKVTDVIDYVMDESIASDRCDECDGKNENSSEIKNSVDTKVNCNTKTDEALEKEIIQDKVLNMPSQGSLQEGRTQRGQETTVNKSAITVGDKVEIEDCPGHWSWASPFTVEAIGGGMVKLEMVSELVEIARLSKC